MFLFSWNVSQAFVNVIKSQLNNQRHKEIVDKAFLQRFTQNKVYVIWLLIYRIKVEVTAGDKVPIDSPYNHVHQLSIVQVL